MEDPELLDQLRNALAAHYDVERVLGHGGMGVVVLGRDRALDRPVAIKVISPHVDVTPRHRQRFLQEARIVAKLRHPNIVAVYAAGEADGLLYFVMEYVPGESLRELLERDRCCTSGRAEAILRHLAEALAFAHARGVVHRDIKPENVLLDHDTGRAMLADFGVAQALAARGEERLTGAGVVVGSPQYMSPEQAAGERELDGRSDIYALGLVGYEMLAGGPAFEGTSAVTVLAKQLTEPPPPLGPRAPGASPALVATISRALEKRAEDRWQDAADIARALGTDVTPAPPSQVERIDPSPAADRAAPIAPAHPTYADHPERPRPAPFVGPGRRPGRAGPSRRLANWLAGASAVLLFAAPLAWVAWPRSGPTAAPRTSVLVVPFDVQSPDTALAWLREESVRMLTQHLAARTDVAVVDYARALTPLRTGQPDSVRTIGLADALQLARRAGARVVVIGQIRGTADSISVTAIAYDAFTEKPIGQSQRSVAAGADPRGLFAAVAQDIGDMTRAPPTSPSVATPTGTKAPR